MFKELLLGYLSLKESDTLQCVKLNRNLLSKWHYASISEEVAQNLTISANGRVYLTRYVMSKEGVQALKTQQATILKKMPMPFRSYGKFGSRDQRSRRKWVAIKDV